MGQHDTLALLQNYFVYVLYKHKKEYVYVQ